MIDAFEKRRTPFYLHSNCLLFWLKAHNNLQRLTRPKMLLFPSSLSTSISFRFDREQVVLKSTLIDLLTVCWPSARDGYIYIFLSVQQSTSSNPFQCISLASIKSNYFIDEIARTVSKQKKTSEIACRKKRVAAFRYCCVRVS